MNRRTATNLLVNVAAFAAFVMLTATGLVERYVLPPGTGRFQSIWGLNRHQWGVIHLWFAWVLMAFLAIHIVLHWNWIVCVVRGRATDASAGRFAFGLVGLVGLVGLSLAPFLATVQQTAEPGLRRHHDEQLNESMPSSAAAPSEEISGSMTLADVERATGVPPEILIRELGLPADVPRDENLGRLRREFGFEMNDVRRIIESNSPGE